MRYRALIGSLTLLSLALLTSFTPASALTASCGSSGTFFSIPPITGASGGSITLGTPCGMSAVSASAGIVVSYSSGSNTLTASSQGTFTLASGGSVTYQFGCWQVVNVPTYNGGNNVFYNPGNTTITLDLPAGLTTPGTQINPIYVAPGSTACSSAVDVPVITTTTTTTTTSVNLNSWTPIASVIVVAAIAVIMGTLFVLSRGKSKRGSTKGKGK